MNIHERLKLLRNERGWSVKDVATRVGVAESTYRDWEYGRQIKGEPYRKIAETFGVSLSYLITGAKEPIEERLVEIEKLVQQIKANL